MCSQSNLLIIFFYFSIQQSRGWNEKNRIAGDKLTWWMHLTNTKITSQWWDISGWVQSQSENRGMKRGSVKILSMCPHSYFLTLIISEKNATVQTLWVYCFFFFFSPRAVCCCWAGRSESTQLLEIYGWNPNLSLSLSHCHLCTHIDTHSLFLRHQPVSQCVPMNPGGHMQSPSASWHTPPFRHSGQSLLQPGPHFLLGQPTGKKSFS